MAKYYNDLIAILDDDLYFEMFEKRGVKFLKIVRSKDFYPLSGLELKIKKEHHCYCFSSTYYLYGTKKRYCHFIHFVLNCFWHTLSDGAIRH